MFPLKEGIQSTYDDPVIAKYGCYFLSLCKYAEIAAEKEIPVSDIWDIVTSHGWIGKESAYVKNPVAVLNTAAGKRVAIEINTVDTLPDVDLYIICNMKPGYTHFTLHTKDGVWDPLDPNRPAAKSYHAFSYRVFT